MTQISELQSCAQRVVYGAMSRAVIETLHGTAPFMSADRSFAENVYNQWVGSDQLLKDVPYTELDYWHVIGGALQAIYDTHADYTELFEQAEEAMKPILKAQQEIHTRMAVLGAGVPSTHFFSKPDLPSAYKAYIVSLLRKVPEIGELELLHDDEDEEASDSDEDESDESDQPDGSDGSDNGEDEEEEAEEQDGEEDEDEEEEDEEEEDDSESEEEEEVEVPKKKKTKPLASKFILGEAKEPAQASDEEEEEEEESEEESEEDEEESEEDEADEEDEEDGNESDGTTESQYWKAEAKEARERMKTDAKCSSDEETPRKKARAQ